MASSNSKGWRCRAGRSDDGATLAEFAFVLPVLLIILFAIFEFGLAFNRAQAVEAAAREGGRLASLSTTSAGDVTNRVNAALAGIPFQGPINVSVSATCFGREGQPVTVTVTTVHTVNVPLVNSWPVNLSSQAVFRCEA